MELYYKDVIIPMDIGFSQLDDHYKYKGNAYKYETDNATIVIKTGITINDKVTIKKFEQLVEKFIKNAKIQEKTNNQSYEIIRGKDGSQLN